MKIFYKAILVSLLSILCTLPLYGCKDYEDTKNIKYVAGMTIDKKGDEYSITFEIIASDSQGQSLKSTLNTVTSNSIHTAFRDGINQTGSKLQLSHLKVAIFSPDIAKETMVKSLDLINRDVELRNDIWLFISNTPRAEDILKKTVGGDSIVSYSIASAVNEATMTGKIESAETFNIINAMETKGKSGIIPLIELEESKDFKLSGSAILYKDKMIGKIDENETQLLMLIRDQNEKFKFVLSIPIADSDNGSVNIEIMSVKRKYKPKLVDGKVVVDINVDIDAAISEFEVTKSKVINNREEREKFIKYIEEYLDKNTSILVNKIQQEYDSDVIGIGDVLLRSQNKQLRDAAYKWNDHIKDANININTKVNIKFVGLTKKLIRTGE